MYRFVLSSANRDILTFFPCFIPFIFFSCLIAVAETQSTVWTGVVKGEDFGLFLILVGTEQPVLGNMFFLCLSFFFFLSNSSTSLGFFPLEQPQQVAEAAVSIIL